jgi:MFS family permease
MVRENSPSLKISPFLVLSLSYALTFAGAGALQQFVIPILRQRGFEELSSYLPLIVIYSSFTFFRFFSGLFVKALGVKISLILGSLTYVLFPFALLFSLPYHAFLFLMFLWGWGAAIYWTAGTVAVLLLSQENKYGSYTGILYTWLQTGFAIGVAILGILHTIKGERNMFSFAFSLSLLGTILLFLLPGFPHKMESVRPKELFDIAFRKESRLPAFYLFISAISLGIMFGSFGEWITKHYNFAYLSLITFIGYAGRIFFAYPGGYVADKWGENMALFTAFLFSSIGLGITSFFSTPLTLSVAALSLGSQMSIVPISATAYIGRRFPKEIYHLASGALLAWNSLGVAVSLLICALLESLWKKLPLVFLLFAIVFFLCGILSLKRDNSGKEV